MLALRSSVPDPRLAQPPAFPASTAPLTQEGPPLGLAARLLLVGAMLTLAPVETVDAAPGLAVPGRWMITPVPRLSCDTAGNRCCRPDAEVPTLHCLRDLGCNVGTGRCEPCGAPDQVCCDGTYTGFSGRSYTGPWLDPGERVTSCNAGAACDSRLAPDGAGWVGSRRCVGCGTREGAACCPPDVRYALGRCSRDVANGIRLVCDDPWAGAAGHCVRCGWRVGDPACATEGEPRCNPGMVESGDRCVFCGSPGSPPCDDGCHAGSAVLGRDGLCVAAGGLGQPCLSSSPPCLSLDTSCNAARICAGCGKPGQPCCPDGSPCFNSFCQRAAEGNRCTGCGYDGSPACPGRTPCPHGGTVVSGWCRPCGKAGQACCRGETIVCESPTRCRDGVCRPPSPGSGEGGGDWRTCSGQPYSFATGSYPIWLEDAEGCVTAITVVANDAAEASGCARAAYADAVVEVPVQIYRGVSCPASGCRNTVLTGRDEDGAEQCGEAVFTGCEILDDLCP